ncbi:hypothetical protein FACS1894130_00650 [Spirochaetia bacterium]|nr:hypothetical protein FACS1894130_00650 [Spirochaetia bacterium]
MVHGALHTSALPSIGYAISASHNGRMSLPVAPASVIYSQFKHVSGVPAPEGTQGVAINKLKVLDVLIEQLSRIKRQPQSELASREALSDEEINALIDQYESQIRQAQAAGAAMPYKAAPAPMGAVFNLVA